MYLYTISISNEKKWTFEAALHFIRMGYTWFAGRYLFLAHRISLSEILWNEVNGTWWYRRKTNIKRQPWECTFREMPSERFWRLEEITFRAYLINKQLSYIAHQVLFRNTLTTMINLNS